MSHGHVKTYLEPYRDPSGLGFTLTPLRPGDRPAQRQLTIVAVCWNFVDDHALFINGAGLVVPSWHNRDALAELLRSRTRLQEFGKVMGAGQFALKPGELKALEGSGRLKPWLVHYLDEPTGYLDDGEAWAAYVEADQAAERTFLEQSRAAAVEIGRGRRADVALPEPATPTADGTGNDTELHQQLEQRRTELDAWRRDELAKERQIAAWLRGEVGGPPLLALMQGAA